MAADTGEKTEKPSAQRLRDARNRGQVARSRDLAVGVSSVAMTLALGWLGPSMASRLGTRLVSGFARLGERPDATITIAELQRVIASDGWLIGAVVGPLLAVGAVVGVAGAVGPSGFVFATEALKWDWTRLGPAQGLGRLAPRQSGVDLIKTVVAVLCLSAVAWQVVAGVIVDGPMLAWMAPADAAGSGWTTLLRLLWLSALCAVAVGVADHGVQFWRVRSSLMMTKQELRDESKSSEGNPEIRSRVRRIQREMSRRRMLKAVERATVVITNPTHYAVALEYRRQTMAAPVVVAKGADRVAARIREAAREHGVPMVENAPLARALHKGAEVGDEVPAPLFGAVAEVLAYLVRIRQLML
ncbi:MAG: EscU/YscU/HrcU family type III secretion system export apparatus switch protein [Acidobacteria bacterium]|nr:EscU/YscU/HrcU family type III secretion system export apparatus switch protein [Acidobacteriota bacterium]